MSSSESLTSPLPPNRTILAVEDEAMLLSVLADELQDSGYHVLCAGTGEDALSVLHANLTAIDLLVTDIRLPGEIDGWGIAEEARRLRPDLPVIYVTGFFSHPSREVSGGMLIIKPYRPSAVVRAAQKLWGES